MVIQMALSRTREYAADHDGAEIVQRPLWLASALRKIDNAARQIPNEQAEAHPASAPLYIINPLHGGGMDNLFSTHPNTENRIAALVAQARQMGQTQEPSAARMSAQPGEAGTWVLGSRRWPAGGGRWRYVPILDVIPEAAARLSGIVTKARLGTSNDPG